MPKRTQRKKPKRRAAPTARAKLARRSPRRVTRAPGARSINKTFGVLPARDRTTALSRNALTAGQLAGEAYGRIQPEARPEARKEAWSRWLAWNGMHKLERFSWSGYSQAATAFVAGFEQASGFGLKEFVPLTTEQTTAAVVTVMNEEATLPGVIEQLRRLPMTEVVYVINGSVDRSFSIARNDRDAVVLHYPEPLGHDVGRAAGVRLTSADAVIFLDGDFVVPAEQLVPFFHAVANGLDIALNDITPFLGTFRRWDHVTMMKSYLNRMVGRSDLKANSLTAIPHAVSRKTIDTLGCQSFSVPPLALQSAVARGLRIGSPYSVDVVTNNRVRTINSGDTSTVSRLIVGDHIEALDAAIRLGGDRLGHADSIRRRSVAGGETA